MANVRVGPSPIHGRGVFARRGLRPGQTAFRVQGRPVPAARVTKNGIQVWRDWYVEPRPPARFINHACQPNCEVTAGLEVRARRAIRAGEELTIDYSSVVLWEPWTMPCGCGKRLCRTTVRAWTESPAAVRRRYPVPLFAWVEGGRVPAATPSFLRAAATKRAASRARAATERSRRQPGR